MRKFYLSCLLMLLYVATQAQTRQLRGRIVDAGNSETLIGASVTVQGTTRGVTTDVNGKFTIEVPGGQNVNLTVKVYRLCRSDFGRKKR